MTPEQVIAGVLEKHCWVSPHCHCGAVVPGEWMNERAYQWHAAHQAAEVVAALGLRAIWAEGNPNDGSYEYVTTSWCDGSNEKTLRRRPRLVVDPTRWEEVPADGD